MRVYEFAKNYDMTSKEIVGICHEIGIEVKAQSKLDEKQLAALSRHICRGKDTVEVIDTEHDLNGAKSMVYIVTECEPFTSLGELGKTAAKFVRETVEEERSLIVVLPKYQEITDAYGLELEKLMEFPLKVGKKEVQASIYQFIQDSVIYLLIGNEEYFSREDIYGYEDDIERFTFFNRAVLEALPRLETEITSLYVNDWNTSLIPLILNVDYKYHEFYQGVETTLNIHNLEYQGWCTVDHLPNIIGISRQYYDNGLTRMGDAVNLLKSGIETATHLQLSRQCMQQLELPQLTESGMASVIERKLNHKAS
ncbi:MAG: translation initiation factor IF-2 N-terminal domain-containing protein [Turicibacter sp.]|nr:translation initiation factor IF-2 N-terminal domain-containing protein [Turicibacter sp.]